MYYVTIARDDRMQRRWNAIAWLVILTLLIFSAGCGADRYLGHTKASYDGIAKTINWENTKNIDIEYNPETGQFSVKSITPETAMLASAMNTMKMLEIMQVMLPALLKMAPAPGVTFQIPEPVTNDCGLFLKQRQCAKYIPERVPVLQWE
jgi:hypothetical protein